MKKSIVQSFGYTVRKIRESKGISQEALAGLCDLHRTYVSDVELGKRNISLENIEKITIALDISLAAFFTEVEKNAGI